MTGTRIIITTIASIILATAVSAGVLFAVESESGESNVSKLATKVAQILGLDEPAVDDAINQARKELKEEAVQSGTSRDGKRSRFSRLGQPDKERVQARLKAAVDAGTITQEQADQRLSEWTARSKDTKTWGGKKARGKKFGPKITGEQYLQGLEKKVKASVAAGEITQQQADEKLEAIKEKAN